MLPSRGLRPAAFNAHKSLFSSASLKPVLRQNKFSTASALTSRARLFSKPNALLSTSRFTANTLRTPAAVSSLTAVRYNSTGEIPKPPPASSNTDALPSFDELTNQLATTDISSMPERIGYLRDLGLDYGWGPTSMLEWVLEHVHVYSGMPWWGSVMTTAIIVRVAMFPLYLRMTDTVAKQRALMPILKPIQERQQQARLSGNQVEMQAAWGELTEAYRTSGIKMRHMFMGPLIQGVLGYCTFKLTRAMANLPVPGLLDGGFLWLSDLTVADPYYILPLATAAGMHLIGRRGGESGAQQLTAGQRKIFLYVLPVVAAAVTSWLPAVTQLSFLTASAFSITQSFAFQNPRVRAALKLTPLYTLPPKYASSGVINTTAASKKNYGTASRINMAPKYEAPSAPSQSVEEVSKLKQVANAPFEKAAELKNSASEWFRNNVTAQAKAKGEQSTGKKGTLSGRRR